MVSQLEQLKAFTTIVADTGDVEAIAKIKPEDATTNPSLILKAATMPEYKALVDDAIRFGKGDLSVVMDKLAVNFGIEITKIVPGYVSTEVDARLSFDTEATIAKGRSIISLYENAGIPKSRILIKIAATWEGIAAAEVLEKEGITCNLTLIFSKAQAIACADAGCTLISPFVGRIMDWYKKDQGVEGYAPAEDPGVISVTEIYNYYKKFGYKTIVMGASFRNVDEILELAGCDRLTMAPPLLAQLAASTEPVTQKLNAKGVGEMYMEYIEMSEGKFRWMMNQDPMATDKLAEGIKNFAADIVKLETIIKPKIAAYTPPKPVPMANGRMSFDRVCREWRCKFTGDKSDSVSLENISKVINTYLVQIKGVSVDTTVDRLICGDCNDFKLRISVPLECFGPWEAKGFAPEKEFLAQLVQIKGVGQVETQTITNVVL